MKKSEYETKKLDNEVEAYLNLTNTKYFRKTIDVYSKKVRLGCCRRWGARGLISYFFSSTDTKDSKLDELSFEVKTKTIEKIKERCAENNVLYFTDREIEKWKHKKLVVEAKRGSLKHSKKLLNHLCAVAKRESFNADVLRIRKKHGIPPTGFLTAIDEINHSSSNKEGLPTKHELQEICETHYLPSEIFLDALLNYCLTGELEGNCFTGKSLGYVEDLVADNDDSNIRNLLSNEEAGKADPRFFPVSIRLSPYVNKRDLLEFISLVYDTEIRPKLEKYQNKEVNIGSIKTRPKSERDDFIYRKKAEGLKDEDIAERVNEKFPNEELMYYQVESIIHSEKKRRKKL